MSLYEIKVIGASFCQVIKINLFIHVIPSITFGNQKWKGAAPLFMSKDEITIHKENWLDMVPWELNNRIVENSKIDDAIAWVKKYFNEASVE